VETVDNHLNLTIGSVEPAVASSSLILGVIQQQGAPVDTFWTAQEPIQAVGGETQLVVELREPAGPIIETSTPIGIVWKPDPAGVAYVQSLEATTGTGGFTEADRAELQIVKMAVNMDLGDGLRGIAQLLSNIPAGFWGKVLITPDRTGSGSLNRPELGLNTAAGGLAWQVISKAPGIGLDEGAPDRAEIQLLELRMVHRLADNTPFTAEHLESAELDGAWIWGLHPPDHMEYWIVPGVTMRFWWLIPGFPPNWQTTEAVPRQIMRDWRP
jgi:hypothetical protein